MKKFIDLIRAHKITAIVVAAVVVIGATVPVGICIAKNDNFAIEPEEIENTNETVNDLVSADATTSAEENIGVENPVEETTDFKEGVAEPVVVTSQAETTVSEPTTSTPQTPPPAADDKSDVVVVQRADPETGISWDGKSPIIYTYADGTTGTEKRDGATYESLPGMIATINLAAENYESDYDGTCPHCGRKGWDGTNGTCLRYFTGGDHTCANCGDVVPENTCHTCDE